jgi:hypothetical protein
MTPILIAAYFILGCIVFGYILKGKDPSRISISKVLISLAAWPVVILLAIIVSVFEGDTNGKKKGPPSA